MQERILGMLLGMAVGDALGLPYENLPRAHASRLGRPDRMCLFFGRGMVSDDTEHALITLEALLKSAGDVQLFQKLLARGLVRWSRWGPLAVGQATMTAVGRLAVGVSPERSGVDSAGCAPLVRALPLGLMITDPETLRQMVRASTRITHTDVRAERAALVMAVAARFILEHRELRLTPFLEALPQWIPEEEDHELWGRLALLDHSLEQQQSTQDFMQALDLHDGVSGYAYHILPVVLHAWFCHSRQYREAVQSAIELGGDTDTVAALVGGLVGIRVNADGIPPEWLEQLWEPARPVSYLRKVASSLHLNQPQMFPAASPILHAVRQGVFAASVMFHVLRRLFWRLALRSSSAR